jgi:hypothetical protein
MEALDGWTGWAECGPLGPDGLVVRYRQAARLASPGAEQELPQSERQEQEQHKPLQPSPSGTQGAGALLSDLLLCESCGGLLRRDSPLDVIEEIDSYYCSQSLDNLPSSEALLLRNCSAKVFECPDCQNLLSTQGAGGVEAEAETEAESGVASGSATASASATTARYYLFCQHCRWDSQGAGLVARSPDELAAAALTRETAYHEDGARLVAALTEHFRSIETKWNSYGLVSSVTKEASHLSGGRGGGGGDSSSDGLSGDDVWRWKDCDAAYEARAQAAARGSRPDPPAVINDALQALHSGASMVVPRRVSLRTKRSLRCRRCSAANLPNIVCKPQINPLKGDSSMRTNVGAWFKKKSLANDLLPRAVCVRDPASRSVLLALTNPRDCPVTMHFAGLGDVVLDAYDEIEELDVFSGTRPPKAKLAREGDDPKLVLQRLCNKVLLRIPEASTVLRVLIESSGSAVHAAPSDDAAAAAAAAAQLPAPGLDSSLRLDIELLIARV